MLWKRSLIAVIVKKRIPTDIRNTLEILNCVLKKLGALYEMMDTLMKPDVHSDIFIHLIWIWTELERILVI